MEAGVSMQEYERNILEQYNIDIRSTRKIRGAVLCDTEQGLYLLKEVTVASERIEVLAKFYERIANQEWCRVDKMIKNCTGNYMTEAENGTRYILKEWFAGRECDIRKPGELLEATGTLAKLHLAMQSMLIETLSGADSIAKEYEKHNREIKKVRSYIRKTPAKGTFEFEFLKCFGEMFLWAEMAENIIEKSGYEKLCQESKEKQCLTHGEYNYHNILVDSTEKSEGILAVTNFEKIKQDIQVEDLYYFLRKVMEKYGWKERLGDSMLNAYSAVKPLSDMEIEYIKIRLIYPEKFWKVANAYYGSNKAWVRAKNVEKLELAIRQTKEKERFIQNVFSFTL